MPEKLSPAKKLKNLINSGETILVPGTQISRIEFVSGHWRTSEDALKLSVPGSRADVDLERRKVR